MRISMIVRADEDNFETAPSELFEIGLSISSQTGISKGKEYTVHAISIWLSVTFLCIFEDHNILVWRPGWLFTVIDKTMPSDWQCNLFRGEVSMVIGPRFISDSEEQYSDMVEREPSQLERFYSRLRNL